MVCPDCRCDIPDRVDVCPRCQAVLNEPPPLGEELHDLWKGSPAFTKPSTEGEDLEAPGARRAARPLPGKGARKPLTGPLPPLSPRALPARGMGASLDLWASMPSAEPARGEDTDPELLAAPAAASPLEDDDEEGETVPLKSGASSGPARSTAPPVPPAAKLGPARGDLAAGGLHEEPLPDGAPQPQARIPTRIVSTDPERARGTQVVALSVPPVLRQARRSGKKEERAGLLGRGGIGVEESMVSRGIDEALASLRMHYARLHRIDRWTGWAALVAFLGSFLPWSYLRGEGTRAGIQEYGAISAVVSALLMLCLYSRARKRKLGRSLLALQVVLAALLAAVPVYRFMTGAELEFSVGLHVTAAAGAAAALLSVARIGRSTSGGAG